MLRATFYIVLGSPWFVRFADGTKLYEPPCHHDAVVVVVSGIVVLHVLTKRYIWTEQESACKHTRNQYVNDMRHEAEPIVHAENIKALICENEMRG